MAIQTLTPPPESVNTLHEGLRTVLHSAPGAAPVRALVESSAQLPQEGAPHPIYTLGLQAIAQGQGINDAQLIGWRYFLGGKNHVHASAETHLTPGGGHAFGGVNFGPFNGPMWERLQKLQLVPELQAANYEFRLLRIPALYVMAFWFHGSNGSDLINPMSPVPPGIVDGHSYQAADFLAALRPLAQQRAEFDNSPRG